jgi:hypothetical protein
MFPVSEYYFTGAYLLPRLIASLYLLAERLKTLREWPNGLSRSEVEQIASHFLQAFHQQGNEARILDWLITGEMSKDELEEYLSLENTSEGPPNRRAGVSGRNGMEAMTPPRWAIKESDFSLIKQTAQLVMDKAVEAAALMITSVLQVGGWQEGQIPTVGSVFWKARVTPDGQIFGGQVIELINQWLSVPGTEIGMRSGKAGIMAVLANELRGVAGLALKG